MYATALLAKFWIIGAALAQAFWPAAGVLVGLTLLVPPNRRLIVLAGAMVGDSLNNWWVYGTTGFIDNLEDVLVSITLFCVTVLAAPVILSSLRSRRRTRTAVAAVFGSFALAFPGAIVARLLVDRVDSAQQVLNWWVGDGLGIAVVSTTMLALTLPLITPRDDTRRIAELVMIYAILAFVTWAGFATTTPLVVLSVAALAWVGVRFGPRASMPAALVVVVYATWRTALGHGPFWTNDLDSILPMQPFNITVTFVSLIVAAMSLQSYEEDQRNENILLGLPDILSIVDRDGIILDQQNPGGMSGLASQVQRQVRRLKPGELLATLGNRLDAAFERDHLHLGIEEVRTTQGQTRYFESRAVHLDEEHLLTISRDVSERENLTNQLHTSESARRLAEVKLVQAELDERERIAGQLHDGPIQELAAVNLQLGLIDVDGDARHRVARIEEVVANVITELRGGLRDLVPPSVSTGQLVDALADIGTRLARGSNTVIEIQSTLDPVPSDRTAIALYKIGREAIGNAIAHSGADSITVELANRDNGYELIVTDNGSGFDIDGWSAEPDHLGVQSMRHRAAELGGTTQLKAPTTGGLTVWAWIPADAVSV